MSGPCLLQQAKVLGKKVGSKFEICGNSVLNAAI